MDDETFAWCLFQEADADGSGALDREEIRALARNLGSPLTEEQLTVAMAEMDEDGGGEVEFDEFLAWYEKAAASSKGGWASKMAEAAKEYMFAAMSGRDAGQFSGGLATRMEKARQRQAGAVSAVGGSVVDVAAGAGPGSYLKTKTFSTIISNDISPYPKYASSAPRFGRRSVSPLGRSTSASPSAGRRRQSSNLEPQVHASGTGSNRRVVYVGQLPTTSGPRARLELSDFLALDRQRADPLMQPQRRGPMPSVASQRTLHRRLAYLGTCKKPIM